jgi:DNA-binding CsgD family transcriptional regulator
VELHGREAERQVIDALLGRAREGRSGALVVRGGTGIGKTALLDYAARAASGMLVLRTAGVETEAELAFAGLHLLLRPALSRVEALPGPQAEALAGALGLSERGREDRFLTGLSVLSLLSDLAEDRPVLCLVDDAHWLDTASADALLFTARRLQAEGVVMVLAARDGYQFTGSGLPSVSLAGLDADQAGRMLRERAQHLPAALRDRVLAEAGGNPLALAELAATLTDHTSSAGAGPLPVTYRVQEVLAAQVRQLGEATGLLLLLAAAETTGDLETVLTAAAAMGIGPGDLAPAERAGLITVEQARLVFRHPLVRAAAYHGAPLAMRHAAHRALAEALAHREDPMGRRAWHLAAAAAGPDDRVAAELEGAAERARGRGGYAAVSAAYERAAQLTTDRQVRARRLLAAAAAANDAGQIDRAEGLADHAQRLATDPMVQAELAYLRTTQVTGNRAMRIKALGAAVPPIASTDPARATVMLCQALRAAWADGEAGLCQQLIGQLHDLGLAAGTMLRPGDEAMFQWARLITGDPGASATVIRDCIAAIRRDPALATPHERVSASSLAFGMGDHGAIAEISAALAADCRRLGMVGWLAGALQGLTTAQTMRGEWADARASALEGMRLACDTGQLPRAAFLATLLSFIAAHAGDQDSCLDWLAEHCRLGGDVAANADYQAAHLALLDLGQSRFGHALDLLTAIRDSWWNQTSFVFQPDLVEAAARSGNAAHARDVLDQFAVWADRTGQPWTRAVTERCRAMVSDDASAERHYRAAVAAHDGDGRPFERARTSLVYGEWLRRCRRRSDARVQLAAALDVFEALGAVTWAHRAASELSATGLPAAARPARVTGVLSRLTPQELQVVKLAAGGMSNRDIGALMFLSPRTVGYHLYKAYPKLGVASRGELAPLVAAHQDLPAGAR